MLSAVNARSAKLSGINSEQVTFFVHVIMGVPGRSVGDYLYRLYEFGPAPGGKPSSNWTLSPPALSAAPRPPEVSVPFWEPSPAGLVMGVINNGMSLMNIGADWQYVVKATVLLLAVWYDIYTRKKSGVA